MFLHLPVLALLALPVLALPGVHLRNAGVERAQFPLSPGPVDPVLHQDSHSAYSAAKSSTKRERYDGHQVLRINWEHVPASVRERGLEMLGYLQYDIWRVSQKTLDVRVPPNLLDAFLVEVKKLFKGHASWTTFVPDVQTLVDGARVAEVPEGGWNVTTLDSPFHDGYHNLDDAYSFGDALVEAFGDMVTTFEVGQTAEGRPIRAWTAKTHEVPEPEPEPSEPAGFKRKERQKRKDVEYEIIVQSGQHAREWVSTAASFYFLHSLIIDAKADPFSNAAELLKLYSFTIVPVLNPDGFAYSHEHSRLWKKNRQNVGGLLCKGIDLNGNWGYRFQPSRLACSDSYKGTTAFEAYETKAMANYIINGTAAEPELREKKVKAFIDLHSYGQLFMFPFAYSCADFPPDAENLMEAGLGVAKAMRTTAQGEGYECGQACDLTYRSTGDAIDYTYGAGDVRWSYSAELRDTGTYGFVLPPHLIRPTGEEVSAGIRYLATFIWASD